MFSDVQCSLVDVHLEYFADVVFAVTRVSVKFVEYDWSAGGATKI